MNPHRRLRVLDLFCGIGGCAAALGNRAEIVCAVDVNRAALDVHALNSRCPTKAATIESIPRDTWRAWNADLWWLSPPCQPYTARGRQRDLADPRAASLVTLIERLRELRPRYLALENVPAFCGSQAHARLQAALSDCCYRVQERMLCPTELGVPNRRNRFYLVAAKEELRPWPGDAVAAVCFAIGDCLDREVSDALWLAPQLVERYRGALHLVDPHDPSAVAACFTSAYGRSHVRSGSYLIVSRGVRRFSPHEILRLLGFPESFRLPPALTFQRAWPLVGNSLSVFAVRSVLSAIPELAATGGDWPGSFVGSA